MSGPPRQGGFGLRDLRPIAGDRGFGLPQRVVERARIDLEEKVALGHVLAFGEVGGSSRPATCDLIWTTADASTVPTTFNSLGTDSCVALATDTGTGGGPPVARGGAACLHAADQSAAAQTTAMRVLRTRDTPMS